MDQPPKPLLDRLPAVPPRPSSKTNVSKVGAGAGKEEAARKRLTVKLEAMGADELDAPAVDPRTAAVASLMVANFVADEEVRKRFAPLVGAKVFDANALEDLPVAARFVLRILPKLGPDLDQRGTTAPPELLSAARAQRERLMRVVERQLADIDDAYGRLVTVRLGDGAADTVYDLRMLAGLCRDYAETLGSDGAYNPNLEREGRDTAQRLEDVLLGPQNDEDREWRAYLLRALAMLVPLYEEVCRAGRFLFHHEKPEARFPSLASVARVRRRLRRETARRIESTPGMPAVRPSAPRMTDSVPPEVSLVEVSEEEEAALANAIEMTPIAPLPIVNAVPEAPAVAPAPTPAPVPSQRRIPIEAIEAVTLDFGAPSAAEDADANLATADLDLEVTYASESNFYSDVTGTELGLFIATFVVKPPGTELAIRLTIPQLDEPIRVSGWVRWVREFSPSIEAPPGMGVALRPIEGRQRKAIDAFMKQRPPILHDE
jgi:hypothetical protein